MKATHLLSMLRNTIAVKRRYWRGEFGVRGSIQLALMSLLLYVPERLVTRLFLAAQIQRCPCRR